MTTPGLRDRIRQRLADERGRIAKQAPLTVALCYPSPYRVGMSSLGYQRIYRALMEAPGIACERAFLDDECEADAARLAEHPVTYESMRPIDELPVLAFSVAYELEIGGLVRMLVAAGLPPRRVDRDERHPLVIAGGPLTFSNPMPLSAIVDAIVVGEADARVVDAVRATAEGRSRSHRLDALAKIPHVFVPGHHTVLPPVGAEDDALLPAHSAIRTPHTELSDMFLIETERGCSRGCSYCVMRRSTNGGMRIVPAERVLESIPADAHRVGLVGAAVSDHPKIVSIVHDLAERGCEVGLSSLRPDRLANTDGFVEALARVGYRTLTTAMDGTSERVRDSLERRARPKQLRRCAELAKEHGMDRLKLYLMVGTPGENDDDVDECVEFARELSRIVPLALGIAPFCPKRNTPLDGAPFAGIRVVEERLARLRRGIRGRVDIRATSARWAWVEYMLAQGGDAEGLAVIEAVAAGGSFRAYERAPSPAWPGPSPRAAICCGYLSLRRGAGNVRSRGSALHGPILTRRDSRSGHRPRRAGPPVPQVGGWQGPPRRAAPPAPAGPLQAVLRAVRRRRRALLRAGPGARRASATSTRSSSTATRPSATRSIASSPPSGATGTTPRTTTACARSTRPACPCPSARPAPFT